MGILNYNSSNQESSKTNAALAKELAASGATLENAQQDVAKFENTPQRAEVQDNRKKLGELFFSQSNTFAGQSLVKAGGNWGDTLESKPQGGEQQSQKFNEAWLEQNKLRTPP